MNNNQQPDKTRFNDIVKTSNEVRKQMALMNEQQLNRLHQMFKMLVGKK